MTTKNTAELESKIERLVRDHLAAERRAIAAAVERAFSAEPVPTANRPDRASTGRRRHSGELAELGERLYDAVRVCPGETMATLASRIGEPARLLNLPMQQLKNAGRVRSAGERNLTRYFPMAAAKAE
jgi:hypothetical protein